MTCEPCTYLLDPEADYLPTLSLDSRQLSLLSGFHTPAKYSENEPQKDGFPTCTCTKEMFGCSIHPTTPAEWIASMQDSLARICQSLEIRQDSAKTQEAGFTAKCCESLAWFDRDTYSWKTSQRSFLEGWEPYSQTWPRAGMTVAGVAWKHMESERRIRGIDGGYSPQWPTPVADDSVNRTHGKINSRGEPKLSAQVKMWPTPKANDAEKRGNFDVTNPRNGLPAAAKQWPTPSASASKGSSPASLVRKSGKSRENDRLDHKVMATDGGQLNPMFVEWLMNWPLNFTKLNRMK